MILFSVIHSRLGEIENQLSFLRSQPRSFQGKEIHIRKNRGDTVGWFYSQDDHGHTKYQYIPKSDRPLAESMAYETLISSRIADLEKERRACLRYLRVYANRDKTIPETYLSKETQLLEKPGFRDLLPHADNTTQIDWYRWQDEDYPNGKNYYPQQLTVKVTDQLYVRSKSEGSIALLYKELHIPFRYEWRLEGARGWVLPDFIAPNKMGELVCIEHLGRADQSWYIEDFGNKLPIYAEKGFYLGVNLHVTAEVQGRPLDLDEVRKMLIKLYL